MQLQRSFKLRPGRFCKSRSTNVRDLLTRLAALENCFHLYESCSEKPLAHAQKNHDYLKILQDKLSEQSHSLIPGRIRNPNRGATSSFNDSHGWRRWRGGFERCSKRSKQFARNGKINRNGCRTTWVQLGRRSCPGSATPKIGITVLMGRLSAPAEVPVRSCMLKYR